MGEPIYDEEYVGVDFCEVFEEEGKGDPIYDDEYGSDDIHEVFEKEDKDEPIEYQDSYKLQWLNKYNEINVSQHSIFHKQKL